MASRFKNFLILICLALLATAASARLPNWQAFLPADWFGPLYEQIKTETIKGLKANFQADVKIGRTSGRIIGQVVFDDVQIPGYAAVKQVKINYDLIRFALSRDIVPAITKITVIDGNFKISREKNGKLNVESLLLPIQPNAPPPPVFRSIIYFQNCQADYHDKTGFRPNFTGFSWSSGPFNGRVDFRKTDRIIYDLAGRLSPTSRAKDFHFTGATNLKNNQSILTLIADKLPINPWANYIIPLEQINLTSGEADLVLNLGPPRRAGPPKVQGWPVGLTLTATIRQVNGKLWNIPFEQANGRLILVNETLTLHSIKLLTNNLPLVLSGKLIGDQKGEILALINQGDVSVNFKLDHGRLQLSADFQQLPLNNLVQNSPGIIGQATGKLRLTGPLHDLQGDLWADLNGAQFFGQPVNRLQSAFAVKNKELFLDRLVIASPNAAFNAVGKISRNLVFECQAESSGFYLSGNNWFGQSFAQVDQFQGRIGGTFNDAFFAAPLKNLSANGAIKLSAGQLGDQTFDLAQGRLSFEAGKLDIEDILIAKDQSILTIAGQWQDQEMNFLKGRLTTPGSKFDFSFNRKNQLLQGEANGMIDLDEFRYLTARYGNISGQLGLGLTLTGASKSPAINVGFWLDHPRFNQITFEAASGNLIYQDNWLTILSPLRLLNGSFFYDLSGQINCAPLLTGSPEAINLNLEVKTSAADVGKTVALAQQIRTMFASKTALTNAKTVINLDDLTFSSFQKAENIPFPTIVGSPTNVSLPVRGQLQGNLSVSGNIANLSGIFSAKVKQGAWQNFAIDQLELAGSFDNKIIRLGRLSIKADRGELVGQGEIGFDNIIAVGITCESFPLSVLRLVSDHDFTGNFNLTGRLSGQLSNPDLWVNASSKKIVLAGLPFDRGTIQLTRQADKINIKELTLFDHQQLSQAAGTINLAPEGKINLQARLVNNALGLFNFVTPDVRWLDGRGTASLEIIGTLDRPDINGRISVNNAAVYAHLIDAKINNLSGEAVIDKSQVKISGLTGLWQGKSSRNYPNFLGLAGTVDIYSDSFFLNLALSPSLLYVDLPTYSGSIKIERAALTGPLAFDLSRGPLLEGQAEINNFIISLSNNFDPTKTSFPLRLALDLRLDKNVYAAMGNVGSLDNYILMNLGITSQQLHVAGDLKSPTLQGQVWLQRGTVTIFNREFTLLNPEMQKQYYPYNPEKVIDNTATFSGEPGEAGLRPEIALVAKVDVENNETENNLSVTKKIIILSRLSGRLGSTDKLTGLKVDFSGFAADPNPRPAHYSDQEIKAMLLPDFIKSLASPGKGGVNTNVVIADYLTSQLQTAVFRGLERQLEQRLGLESLTLEYNFGKNIRQTLGIDDQKSLEGDKPDLKVGFAKGLFDKFYINVNYTQFSQLRNQAQNPTQQVFNYQVTYKLNPIWSIIYYREPISLQELTSGYQKVTLKAGLSFW
ncbi:translocation/assembly module TamB domain-containing protein [Candidatus Saganbacteria bacterium]|nr:translocation/assembly module TamB domain-containing protein [Candidatus Saganbacteria bacterium]